MMPFLALVRIQRRVSGFKDLIRRRQDDICMTPWKAAVEYLYGSKAKRKKRKKEKEKEERRTCKGGFTSVQR